MEINVSVNSFVKLLLVVTFFMLVSTATASPIDYPYVEFLEQRITIFNEDMEKKADLYCPPSDRIDLKIGQVKINRMLIGDGGVVPPQITVKLINGYQISFNYKSAGGGEGELTFTIKPLSLPAPELKEAGTAMANEVTQAIRHNLHAFALLKQFKLKRLQDQFDDSDKAIYTSSFKGGLNHSYRTYIRCYGDHYIVLVVRKNRDPFAANGVLLLGVKVVVGVFIPIGLAVAYYRMAKRRSPTAHPAKKEQTGRHSSQSKGEKPGGPLPRKKALQSAHKVPKIEK